MIHLRVVSPPDVTDTLMAVLYTGPAVMNLIVLPWAVSNPNGSLSVHVIRWACLPRASHPHRMMTPAHGTWKLMR